MNRTLLLAFALCTLSAPAALAQTPSASAPAPQLRLLNPHVELVKAIRPTESQTHQLENVDASAGTKVQETFTVLATYAGTLRGQLAVTPKYLARQQAIQKLASDEERLEAQKKLWNEIGEEIRPAVEKETLKQVRAAMLSYFKGAESIVTAAQKPSLATTRTKVEKNFDKELPALCKIVAAKVIAGDA